MKKLSILMLICLMILSKGCDLMSECESSEQPEINFELCVYGFVEVKDHASKEIITVLWKGKEIKSPVTKVYCKGDHKGPFTSWYKIGNAGLLEYEGIGTWSFRMDNDLDYMYIRFDYEGELLGDYLVYYSDLAPYDKGAANLQFRIDIGWDTQNSKVYYSKVTLLP